MSEQKCLSRFQPGGRGGVVFECEMVEGHLGPHREPYGKDWTEAQALDRERAAPSHDSPQAAHAGEPGQPLPRPGELWRKNTRGGIEVRITAVGPDGVTGEGPGGFAIRWTWAEWRDYVPSEGALRFGDPQIGRLSSRESNLRARSEARDTEPCAARTGSGQMCERLAGHLGPHTSLGGSIQWDEELTRGVSDREAEQIERGQPMRRRPIRTQRDFERSVQDDPQARRCLDMLREVNRLMGRTWFSLATNEVVLEDLPPDARRAARVLAGLLTEGLFGR